MINAIKSIFNAISSFFAFINGTLLPKAHELIVALKDAILFLGDVTSTFLSNCPVVVGLVVSIVIVITLAKLIGGRQ